MLKPKRSWVWLSALFPRTVRSHARSLVGWGAGMVAYGSVMLALYPSVKGNADFAKLLKSYPEALQKLFSLSDYTSPAGYLNAEIFSFMAPLLLGLFAVLLGADLLAGEEGRGTLEMLLANPITRRRVFAEKWLALITMTAVVNACLGLVLGLGSPIVHLHIANGTLAGAIVAMTLLTCLFGTLSLALGAATGRRGLSLGVTAVALVASYFVSALANLITWMSHVRPLSPWYQALGVDPLHHGLSLEHVTVLILLTIAFGLIGGWRFQRRDLGI